MMKISFKAFKFFTSFGIAQKILAERHVKSSKVIGNCMEYGLNQIESFQWTLKFWTAVSPILAEN